MLDATDVQYDACHDAEQPSQQHPVAGGERAETSASEHQNTSNDEYQTEVFSDFLHKNVKFLAKLRNNQELWIDNYEIFRTFAAANCKNNIYLTY